MAVEGVLSHVCFSVMACAVRSFDTLPSAFAGAEEAASPVGAHAAEQTPEGQADGDVRVNTGQAYTGADAVVPDSDEAASDGSNQGDGADAGVHP